MLLLTLILTFLGESSPCVRYYSLFVLQLEIHLILITTLLIGTILSCLQMRVVK